MKTLLISALGSISIALSACGTVPPKADSTARSKMAKTASTKQLVNMSKPELVQYNLAIAYAYSNLGDRAADYSHVSNSLLIGLAATIVYGAGVGAGAQLQANRLLAGLVLTEGTRYAAPNQISRALQIASRQSACMAQVIEENPGLKTATIVRAMHFTSSTLRERMTLMYL